MLPLAITGLGIVSPLGIGRAAFLEALASPETARHKAFSNPRSVLADERFAAARVAEVELDAALYLGDKGLRNFDRLTRMLIVAAKHALEDAGIKRDGEFLVHSRERVGICAATAYGSLDSITEINRVAELEHPRYLNPSRFPNTVINSAAGYVSIWEGLEGPNVTIVDGNCGAADAVLTAETHLASGRADALLVGGGEVLSEPLYLAFRKLGVVTEGDNSSLPGDVTSRGTHLGEGAALMVLEPSQAAQRRGANVLGELVGYGTAFEAPASEAQRDAQLTPADIDLVLSAESGVSRMDLVEEDGLSRVLGSDIPMIATKALWGETFGAASALSLAACLGWLDGLPARPLLRGQVTRPIRTALVMAMGYYGNVSALIVSKRADASEYKRADASEDKRADASEDKRADASEDKRDLASRGSEQK
jgi:3-oxoacyl-[acyl-carrier-protein] synthase II